MNLPKLEHTKYRDMDGTPRWWLSKRFQIVPLEALPTHDIHLKEALIKRELSIITTPFLNITELNDPIEVIKIIDSFLNYIDNLVSLYSDLVQELQNRGEI